MSSAKEAVILILRHITFKVQYNFPGRIKKALYNARACIPNCRETEILFSRLSPGTFFSLMPETASNENDIAGSFTIREPEEEIKLLWISRFDPSKGVFFLLKALTLLPPDVKYKLYMAGDGPQRKKAVEFCDSNNLNYEYLGYLQYNEVQKIYSTAHLFFITSMRDATTTVLFEALSKGLPVIALNHLAFGDIVDDTCGTKVDVVSTKQIATDIAGKIIFFHNNENIRRERAQGALEMAKKHSWKNRIIQLDSIYTKITSATTDEDNTGK
jgi:glycosyltransferase involved in cell wall biosynthesis